MSYLDAVCVKKDKCYLTGRLRKVEGAFEFMYKTVKRDMRHTPSIMPGFAVFKDNLTIQTPDISLPFADADLVELADGSKRKITGVEPVLPNTQTMDNQIIGYILTLE